MDWLSAQIDTWRKWILVLMLILLVAPWAYEAIYVPSPNPCNIGFRVNENICGIPLSGLRIFFMILGSILSINSRFIIGKAQFGEFMFSASTLLFIILPFSGLLLSGSTHASTRRGKIGSGMLILSVFLGFMNVIFGPPFRIETWGVWVFSLLTAIGLVLALVNLAAVKRKQAPVQDQPFLI
jgi:hypothetical protein